LAVLACCYGLPAATIAEVADQIEAKGWLESVVVIGEKTERALKDTVSSVSVISAEILESMKHQTITDAVAEIPNVVSLSGAVPDIRGVSGNGSAGGFNSLSGGAKARVAMLVDGVAQPFVADLTGDSGIWDIEQIEVYRGPQSTSNGRNSMAGSIYIKTKDPSFEWEGAGRLGYRNKEDYVDKALMLSGPLIADRLAIRVSAQRLDAQTITDDKEFPGNPADYDLNEIRTDRLRAKLLWTPSEKSELLLTHAINNEQGDTGRIYYSAVNPSQHNRIYFRDIDTKVDTTSLKFGYQINEGMSLDLLLAYMDYQWGFDSYEPTAAAQQYLTIDEQNITLDAKVNFGQQHRWFNGFVGLAYFEREQDIISTGAFAYGGDDESDSKSLYGELNLVLTDAWEMTLGGRLERESQLRNFSYGPIAAQLDQSKTIFLPKIAVQYAIADDISVAVSARRGYNAAGGALNFTAQEYYFYDEEKVNTYEVSIRSALADGRINLSANLFYNDYDGYQALSSTRFIVNMDKVTSYGAELEVVARPLTNIELHAGVGLLHTEIKDAGAGYKAADGNELNSAPELTANLSVKYRFNDQFSAAVSARYIDSYYGDFTNTRERVAGDYTLTRLNATYESEHWRVTTFVNNLFDADDFITKEPSWSRYPGGFVAVVEPRHVGASITYRF